MQQKKKNRIKLQEMSVFVVHERLCVRTCVHTSVRDR